MKIIIAKNYNEMSAKAAAIITQATKRRPDLVIGLATGQTPLGLYRELAGRRKSGRLDFSQTKFFNLDEYAGLAKNDPASYYFYLWTNFLRPALVRRQNVRLLNGRAKDLEKECAAYEKKIKLAGGLDLLLLGLGHNGHIAFNEPGSDFSSRARLVNLTADTIRHNVQLLNKKIGPPRQALTMGLGTIMEAKKIILLASGADKAKIAARILRGKITPRVPASIIQNHPNAVVILEKEAAKNYKKRRRDSDV